MAFGVISDGVFTGFNPTEIGHVNHAVDFLGQADKQAKFGDVFNLALKLISGFVFFGKVDPRIDGALFEAKADPAFGGINIQHHNFYFLAG